MAQAVCIDCAEWAIAAKRTDNLRVDPFEVLVVGR